MFLEKWRQFEGGVIWENSIEICMFSSVAQSCPTLCDPMNRSTPGLPVHHHLPEFTQTHVHRVGDAIQPSHPLPSPFPPAPNPSQHQSLFQWVNSSHEVVTICKIDVQMQVPCMKPVTQSRCTGTILYRMGKEVAGVGGSGCREHMYTCGRFMLT